MNTSTSIFNLEHIRVLRTTIHQLAMHTKQKQLLLCHDRLILICFGSLFLRLLLLHFSLVGGASLLAEERAEERRIDVVNHFRMKETLGSLGRSHSCFYNLRY